MGRPVRAETENIPVPDAFLSFAVKRPCLGELYCLKSLTGLELGKPDSIKRSWEFGGKVSESLGTGLAGLVG
jgi:hypothetical protein